MKRRIAIFANAWSGAFIEEIFEGLHEEAKKDNTDLYFFITFVSTWARDVDHVVQLNIFRLPNLNDFDGVILLTNTFNTDEEHKAVEEIIEGAKQAEIPVISLEVRVPGAGFMGTENYKGMYDLTKHLITQHEVRDVVYMHGFEGNVEDAERFRAVQDALAEYNLEVRDTIQGDFGYYTAEEKVREWIEAGKELPDAFICANDLEAIGVSTALQNHGYEVPWDVIVTGFDKIKESRISYPMLSTVTRDWNAIAKEAYKEILAQTGNPNPNYERIFHSKFVPSESCGCMATAEEERYRNRLVRNVYVSNTDEILMDGFFQALRISLDQATAKEDLIELSGDILEGNTNFLGPDMAICTEPDFFTVPDKDYSRNAKQYSETMDVLFQKTDRKKRNQYSFDSRKMTPGIEENPDSSDVFLFAPLQFQDYGIGYVFCKNDLKMVFEKRLYRWIINMSAILMALRRNIGHRIVMNKLEKLMSKKED